MLENLKQQFTELYGQQNKNAFFAPGRVNLIGEHIDYNGGLVMPCAITMGTYLLTAPNKDGVFRFKSTNFEETLEIAVQDSYEKTGKEWYNYPLGVIHHFLAQGKSVGGLDLLYHGNLPIGSSLSSSASIEVVTAFAMNEIYHSGFSKLDLVKLSKKVENEFIGVNSGIMDQFAVAFGEKNKALKLNCDTLDYEAVECNLGDHFLAIINTNKPRKLTESKYNERVGECQTALKALQAELDIQNLCDIHTDTFEKHQSLIADATVLKRAKHVVEENDRVLEAAEALDQNRLADFGRLMFASHDSLQHLYEVSGIELDTIVEFCKGFDGVTGARMTGAGFGGCAIALVKKASFDDFSKKITDYYTSKIGYAPSVYSSEIGTGVVEL
ncbi:galactokinase [Arcticibacter tournemirensis]|uniref:Galactokinase n=1 Tax=Arcticibacter tournemirensis TaxID=699437 RepID=A0A5M9H7F5_9SPHI|nr:galactokinase [Arcticibacter tournemirensis]KAA8481801.1 galactokinase [Arcticibacter tournemirensis]TQM50164.1 galactokinase [Arcticibacter tournemirensis]